MRAAGASATGFFYLFSDIFPTVLFVINEFRVVSPSMHYVESQIISQDRYPIPQKNQRNSNPAEDYLRNKISSRTFDCTYDRSLVLFQKRLNPLGKL